MRTFDILVFWPLIVGQKRVRGVIKLQNRKVGAGRARAHKTKSGFDQWRERQQQTSSSVQQFWSICVRVRDEVSAPLLAQVSSFLLFTSSLPILPCSEPSVLNRGRTHQFFGYEVVFYPIKEASLHLWRGDFEGSKLGTHTKGNFRGEESLSSLFSLSLSFSDLFCYSPPRARCLSASSVSISLPFPRFFVLKVNFI